jgi:antirestriction protein
VPWSLNSSGITDIQDPHSQHLIETHSQTFFIALTVSSIHHHGLAQCINIVRQSHFCYHTSPNQSYWVSRHSQLVSRFYYL